MKYGRDPNELRSSLSPERQAASTYYQTILEQSDIAERLNNVRLTQTEYKSSRENAEFAGAFDVNYREAG